MTQRHATRIHVKRIDAIIEILDQDINKKISVRIILNDLTTQGLGAFSAFPVSPGESILFIIEKPISLKVPAKVIWCSEFNIGTHILSSKPFNYRIGIEFTPSTEEEKACIQAFYNEVHCITP